MCNLAREEAVRVAEALTAAGRREVAVVAPQGGSPAAVAAVPREEAAVPRAVVATPAAVAATPAAVVATLVAVAAVTARRQNLVLLPF